LAAELVAGEAQNGEVFGVLGFDGLVEVLEAFELRGEAAFGGCVDDEDDFAFEGGQVEGFAFLCCWGWVSNAFSLFFRRRSGGYCKGRDILSTGLKS
jgi:hypothetical protein